MIKFLFIISISVLIVLATGCDEMQNQVMKPMTMPDDETPKGDETPKEDSVVTSVGSMKDPSAETDDSKEDTPDEEEDQKEEPTKEDTPDETDTPKEDVSDETDTPKDKPDTQEEDTQMEEPPDETDTPEDEPDVQEDTQTEEPPAEMDTQMEDPPVIPQTPVATFVSASPASGDISESDSITIMFDNDPGDVTASAGAVSGSGTSRTISGPFPVGSFILTISWTNGGGSYTLNYNVMAEDTTSPDVTTSSLSDNAVDVDPATVFENGITVTFSEPISSGELMLLQSGVDVGWTASIDGNTITLTANAGQELNHDTTYKISGTVRDSTGNETEVSITFTTESAPAPPPPPETLDPGEGLSIGIKAPDFTLPDGNGNNYTLSDSIGSSNIVIVFFRGNW